MEVGNADAMLGSVEGAGTGTGGEGGGLVGTRIGKNTGGPAKILAAYTSSIGIDGVSSKPCEFISSKY